jgi:SpoVK/Ycf46/Vps4 family AAA+-type ATPase
VQGCGKSLCAKAVSTQWQLPLLRFDMGRMFGSLVGSSEENVRRAISVAESVAPAVSWVDEIDKAFSGSQGRVPQMGNHGRVLGLFSPGFQKRQRRFSWWQPRTIFPTYRPNFCAKDAWTKSFSWTCPTEKKERRFSAFTAKARSEFASFDIQGLADASKDFSGAEIEEAINSALYDAFYDKEN